MRIAVSCLYITLQIIYLEFGDSNLWWGFLNISTHVLMVAYLSSLLEQIRLFNENERLLFTYIKFISIGFTIYTLVCCIRGKSFALLNTSVSSLLLCLGFFVYIVHSLYKSTK